MKNGMYKVQHKQLNTIEYVKAYRGKLTLHRLDSVNGDIKCFDYVRTIEEDKFGEFYDVIGEVKQANSWNLLYYVNGVVKEIVLRKAHFGVCQARKVELGRTTHKSGLLTIVRAES